MRRNWNAFTENRALDDVVHIHTIGDCLTHTFIPKNRVMPLVNRVAIFIQTILRVCGVGPGVGKARPERSQRIVQKRKVAIISITIK
jgi:hypothetical protein